MIKVTIEELEAGDEIIISSNSKMRYLKLLKTPTLSTKTGWTRGEDAEGYFTWDKSSLLYKATLCSTCVEEITYKYKGFGTDALDRFKTCKEYIFESDISKHNKKVSVNLNHKDIILVKKGEIKKEVEMYE